MIELLLQREGCEYFFACRERLDLPFILEWAEKCLSENLDPAVDAAMLELAPFMGREHNSANWSEVIDAMERLCRALGVILPDEEGARRLWILHELRYNSDARFCLVDGEPYLYINGLYCSLLFIYDSWSSVCLADEESILARLRSSLALRVIDGEFRVVDCAADREKRGLG